MRPAPDRSTEDALSEVFPANPIREVDFEIRFKPRLRVQPESWRFQEKLAPDYPDVELGSVLLPNGSTATVTIFQNVPKARVIKVSAENMALAFSAYANFEEFKEEALRRTEEFCKIYEVTSLTRVGLRYVNEIQLPTQETESLRTYVRPIVEFDRIPLKTVQQFALQMSANVGSHMILLRTALLPGPLRFYILDIDAYTETIQPTERIATLLDEFHETAQKAFLGHVTEEYKKVMRAK